MNLSMKVRSNKLLPSFGKIKFWHLRLECQEIGLDFQVLLNSDSEF